MEKEDWERYNRGKDGLLKRFERLTFGQYPTIMDDRGTRCNNKDKCKLALKDLRASHAGQVNVNFTRQPDVIGQTLKLRAEMERMDFCLSCRDALGTVLYEYLNDTWEELPKIFGLTESH